MGPTDVAVGITVATGLLFVAVALLSLRPGSRIRKTYGIDPHDGDAARSNALVLGLVGLGTVALGAAIAMDVSGRVVGTVTVLVGTGLCVGLGWLIRYRDRRELLTDPSVDRETARRLGGATVVCGLTILPLAPAIWFGATQVLLGAALVGPFVALGAIAFAYR
ncbi:hypothetical protein BRC81_00730 [Halobacteriales archaeon QS_1_68_20]|nr:MAG: hypothetical protein BRC81_00730 [Halobacteriales archaeon QS_1_68_20]